MIAISVTVVQLNLTWFRCIGYAGLRFLVRLLVPCHKQMLHKKGPLYC